MVLFFFCKNDLMIERPGENITLFVDTGADIIYIHSESSYHPATAIQKIMQAGKKHRITLSPRPSNESVIKLLNVVKEVLIMGANLGHAGQAYHPCALKEFLTAERGARFSILLYGPETK